MSKYTRGNWIAVGAWVEHPDDSIPDICSCDMGPGRSDEETCANARLIAAAPDLLRALKIAVRQNSHDMMMNAEEIRLCEAAIAKAIGEQK